MEEVNGLVRRKSYDGSDLLVDKSRLGFLNVVHGGGNCGDFGCSLGVVECIY